MPSPYSLDLRQRAVDAYLKGNQSYEEVAEAFSVGEASVNRWVNLYRRTGSVAPRPATGGQPSKLEKEHLETVHVLVLEKPDILEDEIRQALDDIHQLQVSRSAVNRALHRLGLARKKKPSPQPSVTARESLPSAKRSQKSGRGST